MVAGRRSGKRQAEDAKCAAVLFKCYAPELAGKPWRYSVVWNVPFNQDSNLLCARALLSVMKHGFEIARGLRGTAFPSAGPMPGAQFIGSPMCGQIEIHQASLYKINDVNRFKSGMTCPQVAVVWGSLDALKVGHYVKVSGPRGRARRFQRFQVA